MFTCVHSIIHPLVIELNYEQFLTSFTCILDKTWNGDEIYRKKSNKTSTGIAISGGKKTLIFLDIFLLIKIYFFIMYFLKPKTII